MSLKFLAGYLKEKITDTQVTDCLSWARARRMMRMEDGTVQPYSVKNYPWVAELHDPPKEQVYVIKGAQVGATECGLNRALYFVDKQRKDVVYVLPTAGGASDLAKGRFDSATATSQYLKELFTTGDSVRMKSTKSGANLYIRGSAGKDSLDSVPASLMVLDEIDKMRDDAISKAIERLSGKKAKLLYGLSTPSLPNVGIHRYFLQGDQRLWTITCPKCGKFTDLSWPDSFQLRGDYPGDPDCQLSQIICKECKGELPNDSKGEWINGFWRPTNQSDIASYSINQLASCTVSPGDIAKAFFVGQSSELSLKEFFNGKIGMPFIGAKAQVTHEQIASTIRQYSMDAPLPSSSTLNVLGIDRGRWNYATVLRVTGDLNSLDLSANTKAEVLFATKFLEDDFDRTADELMKDYQIRMCVVDADPGTMEARRFAKRFYGHVWLTRYRKTKTPKEIVESDDILTIDRSQWLAATLGRFKSDPPTIELPYDIPQEFKDHIHNLVSTYVRNERDPDDIQLVFVNTGPDHYAHSVCYAELAMHKAAGAQVNRSV